LVTRPLFIFGEGAGDLAHHLAAEIITVGQVIAGGGQEPNTPLGQQGNAQLLHDELAGKPAGVLDDDNAHAIAFNAVEEPRKTLAAFDRIRTTYCSIVKSFSIGNLEAGTLGESSDGSALPMLRVLVAADVGRRARPQIRNSRGTDLGHASRGHAAVVL
jgi:hypothetical protein